MKEDALDTYTPNTQDKNLRLSSREKEVFKYVLDGFENKAISKKLSISIKTVEYHKENLKQKIGVKTIKELYEFDFNKIDYEC